MALLRVVLERLVAGAATLLAVTAAVFFGVSALPGNAAQVALGHSATPQAVKALTKEFGLDRPVLDRYGSWLASMLHGNLGNSLPTGVTVSSLIGDKIVNTAALTAATMVVLIPLALVVGVATAVRPGRWFDQVTAHSTLALIATPSFVVGTILIVVFAFWLHMLPAVSLVQPGMPLSFSILVLPVLTLLSATVAQTIRMIRASMIDVLRSPYIEMARLKGISEARLLFRHALPNALGPTIQILALNIPWLIGDVVVVEAVFGYRGLGTALVSAVTSRDLPTVQAIAVIIAATIIVVNLLADLAVVLMNPRLRRGG
jgi:peptide/nickel transport system permease protein